MDSYRFARRVKSWPPMELGGQGIKRGKIGDPLCLKVMRLFVNSRVAGRLFSAAKHAFDLVAQLINGERFANNLHACGCVNGAVGGEGFAGNN